MASVSISCPSCSATDGVVRNGKSTAGLFCSCRKHGTAFPPLQPAPYDMAEWRDAGQRAGVGLNTILRHKNRRSRNRAAGQ